LRGINLSDTLLQMKKYLVVPLLLINLLACKAQQQSTVADDTIPGWLNDKIEEFITNNPYSKGRIEEFLYREQIVYLVNFCVACPDNLVYVYNEEEEVICEFGGIAGTNTCPDFSKEAIFKGIVWPN
jgi:hypothetical protein